MKKTILTIIISLLLVIILYAVFSGNDRGAENTSQYDTEIRIGLIVPLTGTHKSGGNSMQNGVRLAVDTINESGGVAGAKLTLLTYDDSNLPEKSKSAAESLILKDRVNVMIGPYSSECCLAIKDVVNQHKTPLIAPVAISDEIITGNDYVFRNTLSIKAAQDKINEIADMRKKEYSLLEGFNAKSIGILWQNDSWGKQLQSRIRKDLISLNRENALVFDQSFDIGTTEFKDIFRKYEDRFPDVIYIISSGEEAISIVSQGRDSGYKGLFYGEGGFNYSEFDETLQEKADSCIFTSQWHPSFSTPMSDIFVQLYTQKYNDTPDMFAATSYEAVYILQNSLKELKLSFGAKNFNEILQEDLSIPKKVDGLSGPISFDENGQCDRPMFILQKRWDGKRVQSFIIYPSQYAQGDIQWNFEEKTFH